ncbi:MAG: CheA signal transduction histidine kinase, partial [bacterium]|nr:CheA signal transduction histidine kinase [bacterium]
MTLALIEIEAGRGDAEASEQLGRELHTLKGEARMFGLPAISEVVHAAETLVVRHDGAMPPPAACARVIAGLDQLSRFLRDELGAAGEASAVLADLQRALVDGAADEGDQEPAAEAAAAIVAEAQPAAGGPSATAAKERWTQVSARQVDELCQQVAQFSVDFRALVARFRSAPVDLSSGDRRALVEDLDRCRVQLEGVAGSSWALQLQSIEPTLGELVRHARELALGQGKRLRGIVSAAGAQVERSVLDALWEPLLHIVRNAVDHGIEMPAERGKKNPEATL